MVPEIIPTVSENPFPKPRMLKENNGAPKDAAAASKTKKGKKGAK